MMKFKTTLILGAVLLCLCSANGFAGEKKWKNEAELSYVHTGGNTDVSTFSFKNQLNYQFNERWKSALKMSAIYGQSDGERTAENYKTVLRTDYKLKEKRYLYVIGGHSTDEFAGIDNRYYGGLGAGYHFLDGPNHYFSSELGLNHSLEEYIDDTHERFTDCRAFASYGYAIGENSRFSQEVEYLCDFSEGDNYRINSETALKVGINSIFSLKLAYEVHFDNAPTPETLNKTDTRLYTAITASL
ncbi:MAG: DUF481 domain-containing protein [Desulfobacteraceae bacterium]|jgi:putative salt-induced outer membrane protein